MSDHEMSRYARDCFGFRFACREIESDFRCWRIGQIIPTIRAGYIIGLLGWPGLIGYVAGVEQVIPAERVWAVWVSVLLYVPALAASIWVTYQDRFRDWSLWVASGANVFACVVMLWALSITYDSFYVMVPIPVVTSFFACAVLRLPAMTGILPAFLNTGMMGFYSAYYFRDGPESAALMSYFIAGPVVVSAMCLFIVAVQDLQLRSDYVRRKTIELQQQTIRRYLPSAVAQQIFEGKSSSINLPLRKRVTILFSDIVGFTSISDSVEPEVLTEVVNEYMAAMASVVEERGGTVSAFIGDGLMALFGAPFRAAPEDQAAQAIEAASAMQNKLRDLNEKWRTLGLGSILQVRIGINTGVASVGSFGSEGRVTYTAIGQQVNIASRIESHAAPGAILISDSAYQLVCDEIECEPKGEIEVKGVHYPIKVYEVKATA